jgi:hypothetical protein
VPIASTAKLERRDHAIPDALVLDLKIGAVEYRAMRQPEDEANIVAA